MGDEIKMMNKKGALVLRDIMFMLIIFGGILALSSLVVVNMASEYDNEDMNTEYYAENSIGSLGDEGLVNVSASIEEQLDETTGEDGMIGSFSLITGAIKGIGTIISVVVKTPVYIGDALDTMLTALRVPDTLSLIMGKIVTSLIYVVIIFVIMSAFLRGGKV